MPALPAINNLRAVLQRQLLATDTTAMVVSTAGWPSYGVFSVDKEVIAYTSLTPTAFNGLVRGSDGTLANAHSAGSILGLRIIAKHLNDAAFINLLPSTVGVGGIPVGSTFPNRLSVQEMFQLLLYPNRGPEQVSLGLSLQILDSIDITVNRTTRWLLEFRKNSQIQTIVILATHDGSTSVEMQQSSLQMGSGDFDVAEAVDLVAGQMRLTVLAGSFGWTATWERLSAMPA